MRHTSPRVLRVRQHPARAARISPSLALRLREALRSAAWWAPSLAALLVIAVALSGAGTADTAGTALGAHTLAPARPWVGRASPPAAPPPIARWQDIKDGTAYALHLSVPNTVSGVSVKGGNLFTFTTPTGDEIAGLVPLVKLPDQSYAQATTNSDGALICQGGTLIASSQTNAPNAAASTSFTQPVAFELQARFDQYLLVAYVQILYAPTSDQNAVGAVCKAQAGVSGVTSLEMIAGCTATSCTSPLDNAMAAPPAYEQAMIHAMQQRGLDAWSAVWALTSRTVTAQYNQSEFAALMNRLSDQIGTITAITATSGPPSVLFDSGGQAYFTLVESVTYTHGGKSKTVQITSYYLLEGGEWMFWFSA